MYCVRNGISIEIDAHELFGRLLRLFMLIDRVPQCH
jgi:hypothetical protein